MKGLCDSFAVVSIGVFGGLGGGLSRSMSGGSFGVGIGASSPFWIYFSWRTSVRLGRRHAD